MKNPYKSFNGRGIDVASNRADDLDKFSLVHFSEKNAPLVLDLGCGVGGHSVRMAGVGVYVTAIDNHDFSNKFRALEEKLGHGSLGFICGDIRDVKSLVKGKTFSDAYMQRTIHYLNYESAAELLKTIHKITEDKLFISVMGIESEAGRDYQGNEVEIEKRFFKLNKEEISKLSIEEPVCLYTKEEFTSLLEKSGWKVERCWQSAFGNIKAVCTH